MMGRIIRQAASGRYNTFTDRVLLRRTMSRRYYNTEKYAAALTDQFECPSTRKRDVIIVGGGHNGLVAAAYLANKDSTFSFWNDDTSLVEQRLRKKSYRISSFPTVYLAGLLRNSIIEDLELEKKYDFEYIPNPFPRSLRLDWTVLTREISDHGSRCGCDWKSIAQWSERDADAFVEYEQFLDEIREIVEPLLEGPPPNPLDAENYREMESFQEHVETRSCGNQESFVSCVPVRTCDWICDRFWIDVRE